MANPQPKTKGQEKKSQLDLNFSPEIKLENNQYRIEVRITFVNVKGELIEGQEFVVLNQNFERIFFGTAVNGEQQFTYFFDAAPFATKDKPTVELRAEATIEGKFVTSQKVKIELPPARKPAPEKIDLELFYSSDIRLANGRYAVDLRVTIADGKGKKLDQVFQVVNQALNVIFIGKTTDGECNFTYEFDATPFATKDKPTIELRAEATIEGKYVTTSKVKIELPTRAKAEKILYFKHSDPWSERGRIYALFEILVVDGKDKPIKGAKVTFSDNYSRKPYHQATTDEHGRAFFKYHGAAVKLNTKKQIRAFLTDNPSVFKESEVLLNTTNFRGWWFLSQAWLNLSYWKADILKHLSFQAFIFLPALIMFGFLPKISGAVLMVTLGFFWFMRGVQIGTAEKTKQGVFIWAGMSAVGIIFSPYVSSFFFDSVAWACGTGLATFLIEKITQRLETKKDGPAEFKKFADFHPWWGIIMLSLFAGINFIMLIGSYLDFSWLGMSDSMGLRPGTILSIGEPSELQNSTVDRFVGIIQYLLAIGILLLTNAFQDIREKLMTKLGDLSPMRIIEHGLFIKEASDILRGKRGGKS